MISVNSEFQNIENMMVSWLSVKILLAVKKYRLCFAKIAHISESDSCSDYDQKQNYHWF